MFTLFRPSLLHSRHALLLRHRWRINTFSNFKIHRRIYSHCLTFLMQVILSATYHICYHCSLSSELNAY